MITIQEKLATHQQLSLTPPRGRHQYATLTFLHPPCRSFTFLDSAVGFPLLVTAVLCADFRVGALDASVVHVMADSDGSGVRNVPFTTNMSSAAASYVQASKFLFWLCSNVRGRTSASFSMGFCVYTRVIYTLADGVGCVGPTRK